MLTSVFFGNSSIVIPALEVLMKESDLKLIITNKDKTSGRGRKNINIPEPKEFALKNNIPFIQIDNINDLNLKKKLKEINPEIGIIFSFGFIIPEEIYTIPHFGLINIHASLLPKYRGASPIQLAILNNEKITGITFQKINKNLDCGDILFSKKIEILEEDDYISLKERISILAAESLKEFLSKIEKNELIPISQNEEEASYCKKILKEDGEFRWNENSKTILAKIRAFVDWPHSYVKTKFGIMKVFKAKEIEIDKNEEPATVLKADKTGFIIACGKNALEILELQIENKRRMDYISFLNGHRIKIGEKL